MLSLKKNKEKIFCIGRNKTGTTSLEKTLIDFGFKMGIQAKGEMLINDYAKGNFKPIIKFCKSADAFQDAPFSWPYTWLILYEHFPKAKFILTEREENNWYNSLTSFHSKLFTDGKRIPIKEDLEKSSYRYRGFLWEANRVIWKTPEDDIYNKEELISNFRRHNNDVTHFFKDKFNFIKIDVSKNEDYFRLCSFLDKEPIYAGFPHLNKTKKLK